MSKIIAYMILGAGILCGLVSGYTKAIANSVPEQRTLSEIDESSAIILVYHRIGEDYAPDESLRTEQFQEHINTLISNQYNVLPLATIVDALANNKPLPTKSVAITFDGGFKSILRDAIPLLTKNNFPFTIFYASSLADSNNSLFMNWEDIEALAKNDLATLGVHPSSYARLHGMTVSEMKAQLNKAKIAFREHFNKEPDFYAYPFGEYSQGYTTAIKNQGYRAAFGLHSGVAYSGQNLLTLPRFSLTEKHGDPEHFKLIINARPLPTFKTEPEVTTVFSTTPPIGFTLHPQLKNRIHQISCFVSDQPKPEIEIMGETRIEIRLKNELPLHSKTRINCTIPVPQDENSTNDSTIWRWMGMILTYDNDPESMVDGQNKTQSPSTGRTSLTSGM